jgi:hypothetical protein
MSVSHKRINAYIVKSIQDLDFMLNTCELTLARSLCLIDISFIFNVLQEGASSYIFVSIYL